MAQDLPENKIDVGVRKLIGVDGEEPLADLERRGLVRRPAKPRTLHVPRVKGSRSVSDLVADQRR